METKRVNYWEHQSNGMVFLSYSSQDYPDVKLIKDYLEERNFSSLMFYQKCLNEVPTGYEEQSKVLKELKSSNAFVLCNSSNAKGSTWVQTELRYLSSLNQEKFLEEIDIDNMKYKRHSELSKLDKLVEMSSLYFIYEDEDKSKVENIDRFLSKDGFRIFRGNKYQKEHMLESIKTINENSYIILFLSKTSTEQEWYKKYEKYFKDSCQRENILFVSLDETAKYENFELIEKKNNWLDMSVDCLDNDKILLQNIKEKILRNKDIG